jgi:hypothetical protein
MGGVARAVALTGSDQIVRATATIYRGITVRETGGAAAVVVLYDNASAASGTIIEEVSLGADESVSYMHPVGLYTDNGIFLDVVSGDVEGSVRVG